MLIELKEARRQYNWIRSIVRGLDSLSRRSEPTARNCGYMRDRAVEMQKRKGVP